MGAPTARDTYRHGNLRSDAVAAARHQVNAEGHAALSLRKVAQQVGVAHRSLYNHFADREALLDAVAESGFLDLAKVLQPAMTREAYVAAYIGFALESPHLHALMVSRPHATMKARPDLRWAVHQAIAEALRLFGEARLSGVENRRAVMKVLILLQGGLSLHAAGILDVDGDAGLVAELQAMIASG